MTQRNQYHLSPLLSAYNFARAYGRQSGLWDNGRVNRALSYLMSGKCSAKWEEHSTTINSCRCKDQSYRAHHGIACKHRISKMIHVKYCQLTAEPKQGE